MTPIGFFKCNLKQKIESPRQGTLTADSEIGQIRLIPRNNFEQALIQLETFSHIWIIYEFHLNKNWKPMVLPPRGEKKVGVFASRSPYRPNQIGICAAELIKIEGLKIFVKKFDLLDNTPILDIKPYLKYSDSLTSASDGWTSQSQRFEVIFSKALKIKIKQLKINDLKLFHAQEKLIQIATQQLSFDPFNKTKKRVKKIQKNLYEFAYRYSRVYFTLLNEKIIQLEETVI